MAKKPNSENTNLFIEGYNFIHKSRKDKIGGGVGFFIENNTQYKQRDDLDFFDHQVFESMFLEIVRPKQSNIIIGTIYRPPDANLAEFNLKIDGLLSKISKERKPCYLMGDFNIDLLKYEKHSITNNYLDNIFSHCFLPFINRPTRITAHSASLIDNILTNNLPINTKSGILFTDISDHLPVFMVLPESDEETTNQNKTNLVRRLINAKTKEKFKNQLSSHSWDSIYSTDHPEEAYNNFVKTYKEMYNECFHFKTISQKQAKLYRKPWITKGLQKSIKTKYNLYKKYLRHPSLHNETRYKKYKNRLNHLLKIPKRNHYDDKFENAKGNLKQTWKILNEIINKRKTRSKMPSTFIHNNQEISDPFRIANKFCEYFTNVGPSFASKLPNSRIPYETYLSNNRVSETIFLKPVTERELKEIACKFKTGKASGFDQIKTDDIKCNIKGIAGPLSHIINRSFATEIVPQDLKTARIIPIYKKDEPNLFGNYRPISILPAFSKFFEKDMYDRMIDFINKHNILFDNQYGFRSQHSTSLVALIRLIDQLSFSARKSF